MDGRLKFLPLVISLCALCIYFYFKQSILTNGFQIILSYLAIYLKVKFVKLNGFSKIVSIGSYLGAIIGLLSIIGFIGIFNLL